MAAERRPQILAAAARVIARRGLTALRLADVADEAGVSVGTIQHYFGTRERLLLETFAFETERSLERWVSAERNGTGAWAQVLALIEIVLHPPTFRERWTRWLQFWAAYARDPKLRPSMGEVVRPLARSVPARDRGRGRVRRVRPGAPGGRDRRPDGRTLRRARAAGPPRGTGHEPRPHARASRHEPRGRPGAWLRATRSGESAARVASIPSRPRLASSGT